MLGVDVNWVLTIDSYKIILHYVILYCGIQERGWGGGQGGIIKFASWALAAFFQYFAQEIMNCLLLKPS